MRSKLVFGAITQVPNRFLLVKLASKASRALHRPNSRIQETMNDVFVRFSRADPIARVLDNDTVQSFDRAAWRRFRRSAAASYGRWKGSAACSAGSA
jgi:hypothetical protein